MNYRKVYGGTPVGEASLCDTCVYSHIIRGYSSTENITICTWPVDEMVVPFKVRECSGYANRTLPEFEDLEKIAWDLTKVKGVKPAGFKLVGDKDVAPEPGGDSDASDEENEPAVAGFTKPGGGQD